jgi:hypothetical protein
MAHGVGMTRHHYIAIAIVYVVLVTIFVFAATVDMGDGRTGTTMMATDR